jgi:protein-tyrosine-phosphatase/N-acetylglutamate synthase-like GNAT family acetyltransferase
MNTVLFACIHNAGRSQMAAAWFNALSDTTKARAISAGTEPGARVHPEVVEAMREVGIEVANNSPQKLTDELASKAAILITMGCGEACPVIPGLRRLDWPLEDPKGKPIERVREIRDDVRQRVLSLLERERWLGPDAARPEDLLGIQRLLTAANLPIAGLETQFPVAYVVYRQGETVIGVAGLERHGTAGLLRSVAVLASHRGTGIGSALVGNRLRYASDLGLREVFLLTTTASTYFGRFGFTVAERASAPAAMQESPEFAGVCPASAACLVWRPRETVHPFS